jgi:2'-5' RNA ligase
LESLTGRIDSKLETFGFEKERRSYRAHITLARAKHGPLDAALVTAANQFEERDFGTFHVDRCFLYQSELTTNGPQYTKLREYLLS